MGGTSRYERRKQKREERRTFETLLDQTRVEAPLSSSTYRGIPSSRWKGITGVNGKGKARVPWSKLLEAQHDRPADDDDRRRVARSLGMKDAKHVPKGLTVGELLAWQTTKMALQGQDNAVNAVLDRVAPKPKRVEVAVSDGPSRAPVSADEEPSAQEAEDYMRELEGE